MANIPLGTVQEMSSDRRIPQLRGKRCLVTGGAGMIGSHLVARLLVEEARSVTVLDDLSSGRPELVPDVPAVRFLQGSVNDQAMLDAAFADKPQIVFHLAALFANQNSVDHPLDDLRVNALGTLQILERCHGVGVQRMVFASSSCVYSTHLDRMREDCRDFSIDTPYAISKLMGERYCHYYFHHHHLPVVILRYFNAYGPHEFPGQYRNVVPNFFALAMAGKPLPIHGDGSATRDFTFVEDTVEGTCLVTVCDQAVGGTFNLGTGTETSVLQLATLINRITGNQAGVRPLPTRSWDKVRRRHAEIDRAASILGYRPHWKLGPGLLRTYQWLQQALAQDDRSRGQKRESVVALSL